MKLAQTDAPLSNSFTGLGWLFGTFSSPTLSMEMLFCSHG